MVRLAAADPEYDEERKRLEREVIEAAKADLAAETRREGDNGIDRLIAARRAYRAAVLALIEFESQHQLRRNEAHR